MYLFDYTNSSVLSLRGNLLSVSPCYCYAKGRFFIIFGQAAGWFVGGVIGSDFARGALPVVSVFLIVLLCVYITIATIKPDKYPIVNEFSPEDQALTAEMPPPPAGTGHRAPVQAQVHPGNHGLRPHAARG